MDATGNMDCSIRSPRPIALRVIIDVIVDLHHHQVAVRRRGSVFGCSLIAGCRPADANLSGADPRWASLKRAHLGGGDLDRLHLNFTIGIVTSRMYIRVPTYTMRPGWADLGSADLSSVDLRTAHLNSADLRGAQLIFADLNVLN